ncbi:MAG TPA: DUF3810 family protein [Terriglobia bacterium]|nr:DUF3810 family protein [Terriglobia bacterium]
MAERARFSRAGWLALPAFAALSFLGSWAQVFPRSFVENTYSRGIYPKIAALAAHFADAISFSWLDVFIPIGLIALIAAVRLKRYRLLANGVAALYLFFFWSWGLNYHREALADKLPSDVSRTDAKALDTFAREIARNLNRLYPIQQARPHDEQAIREEAVRRVSHVTAVIDGAEWRGSSRIKHSVIANPWFHAASIDGVFNLFAHEPVVSDTLLDFEQPFAMTHELGHVYGYAGEGDANLIAVLATLMSSDPRMQYSGWINLWFYARTPKLDALLDPGPRQDMERMFNRLRSERIRWLSALQTAILDWYLKSNAVHEGVQSYDQVVVLAASTQPYWDRYR